MLLYNNQSFLTNNNSITTYTDMNEKFDQMLEDIENAEDHIHFQYYIFRLDGIGKKLYNAMLKKQKEGVSVKILYDDMGSRALNLRQFREIKSYGGEVEAFFTSFLTIINPSVNNRNHRKIVVIDGKIGISAAPMLETNISEKVKNLVLGETHTSESGGMRSSHCSSDSCWIGTIMPNVTKWYIHTVSSLSIIMSVIDMNSSLTEDQTTYDSG